MGIFPSDALGNLQAQEPRKLCLRTPVNYGGRHTGERVLLLLAPKDDEGRMEVLFRSHCILYLAHLRGGCDAKVAKMQPTIHPGLWCVPGFPSVLWKQSPMRYWLSLQRTIFPESSQQGAADNKQPEVSGGRMPFSTSLDHPECLQSGHSQGDT